MAKLKTKGPGKPDATPLSKRRPSKKSPKGGLVKFNSEQASDISFGVDEQLVASSTFRKGQKVQLADDSTALTAGAIGTVLGVKENGRVVVSFAGPIMVALTSAQIRQLIVVTEDGALTDSTISSISRGEKIRELTREGRNTEALPLLMEVLRERVEQHGESHPDVLKMMSSIGRLLQSMGRVEDALPMFEAVLAGRQTTLGEDHSFTLNSMNDLGLCLKQLGDLEHAEVHYAKAMEGRNKVFGPTHPKTLTSLNNVGI